MSVFSLQGIVVGILAIVLSKNKKSRGLVGISFYMNCFFTVKIPFHSVVIVADVLSLVLHFPLTLPDSADSDPPALREHLVSL